MAVKIKELAERLGLSPATVSMALNNRPGVSSRTRERVARLAEELGEGENRKFSHNRGNIQLIVYKKHGRVIDDTPFFSQLIEGMGQKCAESGYTLSIAHLSGARFDSNEANACINRNSAGGAILLATEMDKRDIEEAMRLEVDFIAADGCFIGQSAESVTINNSQGAYIATNHLIENNHESIGHLASAIQINNFTERRYGYERALYERGLKPDERNTIKLDSTLEGAYEDMLNALKKDLPMPTAFFADNDIIALGAIKALKERGYRVPEDISVVGFDDMPYCAVTEPPLTTVNVDKKSFGQIAVKLLIEKMQRIPNCSLKTELGVNLVVRESVKNYKTGGLCHEKH